MLHFTSQSVLETSDIRTMHAVSFAIAIILDAKRVFMIEVPR